MQPRQIWPIFISEHIKVMLCINYQSIHFLMGPLSALNMMYIQYEGHWMCSSHIYLKNQWSNAKCQGTIFRPMSLLSYTFVSEFRISLLTCVLCWYSSEMKLWIRLVFCSSCNGATHKLSSCLQRNGFLPLVTALRSRMAVLAPGSSFIHNVVISGRCWRVESEDLGLQFIWTRQFLGGIFFSKISLIARSTGLT